MQILEPILFDGVSHLIANANQQENEEINMAFAHNEGALIIACRAQYAEADQIAFADVNQLMVVALRTSDSVASGVLTLGISQDTIWMTILHLQGIVDSAVGGDIEYYKELEWSELPGGGVIIASNPFGEFRHVATQTMSIGIAFKRVLFDDNELVRFIALRRR